jgi:hypothetical protein
MIEAQLFDRVRKIARSSHVAIITARADQPSMRGPADVWVFTQPSKINPDAVFTVTRTKQRK